MVDTLEEGVIELVASGASQLVLLLRGQVGDVDTRGSCLRCGTVADRALVLG